MRSKVLQAAKNLGYSPSIIARSLTTRRTKLIGLISNNFHNPVFLQVFDLFTRGLQERGLRPLLVNLSDVTAPAESLQMLRQYSVDGVVVASSHLPEGFAKAFRDAGMPVVHTFGRHSQAPEVHVVGVDNIACGRMAAIELIRRGYRRIGFMGGPEHATTTRDRMAGFLAAAAEHPGVSTSCSFSAKYAFDAGRAEMARLAAEGLCEAYFCGDDVLSIGAMSAIESAGLRVPEDIGIIGFNDMEMARWENIALTTIHQPIPQIIAASVDLMVSLLEDPEALPESRLFPCRVIERSTLRPIAGA